MRHIEGYNRDNFSNWFLTVKSYFDPTVFKCCVGTISSMVSERNMNLFPVLFVVAIKNEV